MGDKMQKTRSAMHVLPHEAMASVFGLALRGRRELWDEVELLVYRRSRWKAVAATVAIVLLISAAAECQHAEIGLGVRPAGSLVRTVLQCVLAFGMLIEYIVMSAMMPPAKQDCDNFQLEKLCGDLGYLTFWILLCQTIFQVASAISEGSLFLGTPLLGLLYVCYSSAVLMDAMGLVLTLLFLKFCYFDDGWRSDVKDFWELRGIPMGARCLISHGLSLPIGLIDVLARDATLLRRCTPSLVGLTLAALAICVLYFVWIHILWAATGCGHWPYPFLYEFETFPKRVLLFVGISIACLLIMLFEYYLAAFASGLGK